MHLEEISRLCPIDKYWSSQWVDETEDEVEIDAMQVIDRRGRRDDAIERVTRL